MIIIALDLETTGLIEPSINDPHYQPGIIEIGAVKITLAEKDIYWWDQISQLINPEKPQIEDKIFKITGINREELHGQPTFETFFPQLANYFLGAHHLVTFNGNFFDKRVLDFQLQRYGKQHNFPWPPISHDLMHISKDIVNLKGRGDTKWPKLIELYKFLFGKEFEGQHRAVHDAKATMECFLELHKQGHIFGL